MYEYSAGLSECMSQKKHLFSSLSIVHNYTSSIEIIVMLQLSHCKNECALSNQIKIVATDYKQYY